MYEEQLHEKKIAFFEENNLYVKDRFVETSVESFEEVPFNNWKTCVILFRTKYGEDYSESGYEFIDVEKSKNKVKYKLVHNPKKLPFPWDKEK